MRGARLSRALASAMRSRSAAGREKRRVGRVVEIITTCMLVRNRQRGQLWNGDDAAAAETVK